MTSVDLEKSFIISEIEDNLSSTLSNRPKAFQEDVNLQYSERDNLITQETLTFTKLYGLDGRLLNTKQTLKKENVRVTMDSSTETNLDNQFDYFVSTLESLELIDLIYNYDEDMDSYSAKERLVNMKLPLVSFETLLEPIKSSDSVLHRSLLQLPLISGSNKIKRKAPKKDRRKERKDKDLKEKDRIAFTYAGLKGRLQRKERKDREGQDFEINEETLSDPNKFRELLAITVGRNIADNSMASYLVTIALLLKTMSGEEKQLSTAKNYGIPAANLIAALFEQPHPTDEASQGSASRLPNPFQMFLSPAHNIRTKSITNSDLSRYDAVSLDGSKEECTSQQSGYYQGEPHSDAGSTIGSTHAELGTETASMTGDEITEEELLAQALALSMGDGPPSTSANGPFIRSTTDMSVASTNPDLAPGSSPTNEQGKEYRTPILGKDSLDHSEDRAVQEAKSRMPEGMPLVAPFSTFGPFSREDFWGKMRPSSSAVLSHSNLVPNNLAIRHIIIALLTVAGVSSDLVVGECSTPVVPSKTEEKKGSDQPSESKETGTPNKKSPEKKQDFQGPFMSTVIPISPNHTTFLLIEFLLGILMKELQSHCSDKTFSASVASMNSNFDPLTGRKRDSESKLSSSTELDEWCFHLYFLQWSILMLLKILRSQLHVMVSVGISAGSLGFDSLLLEKMSDAESEDSLFAQKGETEDTPFILKLMGRIYDCMGMTLANFKNFKSVVDTTFTGMLDTISLAEKGPSPGSRENSLRFLSINYRHHLRIAAMGPVIFGFSVFFPHPVKRLRMLLRFVQTCPTASDIAKTGLFDSQSLLPLLIDGAVSLESMPSLHLSEPDISYYKLVVAQKLCIATLNCESAIIKTKDPAVAVRFKSEPELGGGFVKQIDVPIPTLDGTLDLILSELQSTLLARLESPYLLSGALKKDYSDPSVCLFAGELALLRSISRTRVEQYSRALNEREKSLPSKDIMFSNSRCHPNLILSDDYKMVRHQGPKLWASVTSVKGFEPDSGVYEWVIRVDSCAKGHVFLGVVTADASAEKDSYVGVDRYGWGLIGTRSLWHNKSKVVADYGTGFGTGSIITVRYNSFNYTLSFKANDVDWGNAFDNLPKQKIYAACSLHEKNDQISFLYCNRVDQKQAVPLPLLEDKFVSMERAFLIYFTQMYEAIEKLLDLAQSSLSQDVGEFQAVMSHPFIGCLLPSVSAFFCLHEFKSLHIHQDFFRLVPMLTVLAKRLSALIDAAYPTKTPDKKKLADKGTLKHFPLAVGSWSIFSAACNGLNMPAQEYTITLKAENNIPLNLDREEEKDEGGGKAARLSMACRGLAGQGSNGNTEVSIHGTQFGSKIKFLETWNRNSGQCLIEGRLSLCGSFFDGNFTDIKTGKMGFIRGLRTAKCSELDVDTIKRVTHNCALLCTMASARLTSNLAVGDPYPEIWSSLKTTFQTSIDESSDPAEDAINIAENSFISGDEQDVDADKQIENDSQVRRWVSSNLFSGGLEPVGESKRYLSHLLNSTIGNPVNPDAAQTSGKVRADASSPNHWWVTQVLPSLFEEDDTNEKESSEEDMFYTDLKLGTGAGSLLDEFLSLHAGHSAVVKIGGEPLQRARRLVLAALVKHSGCFGLAFVECQAISSGVRERSDRPNSILLDVWRAAHRVIERMIRLKQENGTSYAEIAAIVTDKTDLLMKLQTSKYCRAVQDSLFLLNSEFRATEWWLTESGLDIQQDCAKLLADAVEFLICPLNNAKMMYKELQKNAYKAVIRSAGLRAFMILLEQANGKKRRLPALATISMQSSVIHFVLKALREIGYRTAASENSPSTLNSSPSLAGHYLDGLQGVSASVLQSLKKPFESVFHYVSQLLLRSTWGGHRDGQLISISAWGLVVKPDDHIFLNQIGIFRTLQTVLDDTRVSLFQLTNAPDFQRFLKEDELTREQGIQREYYNPQGLFACKVLLNSQKRLAQLVLCIVHGLASQVAYVNDQSLMISGTSAPRLQKTLSGPDTLSKSLFDLMYTELFTVLKKLITSVNSERLSTEETLDKSQPTERNSMDSEAEEELLEGESYIYRILRLLYLVSVSKVCQVLLTSPKWISLLLSGIGFGGLSVQRRLLRLLRRLLLGADPNIIIAFVPTLLSPRRDEISFAASPMDDDDFEALAAEQAAENSMSTAQRLLVFLLHGVSVVYIPLLAAADQYEGSFVKFLLKKGALDALSADCLIALRVLHGIPGWRKVINQEILTYLNRESTFADLPLREKLLFQASLAVLGGNFERARIGGLVNLRPFCLVGTSENFATKLAGASHTCAMLVSLPSASATVEVVLMERAVNIIGGINNKYPKSRNITEITAQHFTNLAGSFPVRSVRLNANDVVPCSDIAIIPELIPFDVTKTYLEILRSVVLPWIEEASKTKTPAEEKAEDQSPSDEAEEKQPEPEEAVDHQILNSALLLRGLSVALQKLSNTELFAASFPDVFALLLKHATQSTELGNLTVLEALEERFSNLWSALGLNAFAAPLTEESGETPVGKSENPSVVSRPSEPPVQETPSARVVSSRADLSTGSPLRDLASILSPFGVSSRNVDPNTQAAALSQMLEIGLPQEWCEFALRRCHYNVEMAINLCLEHGSDMSQLIAEEMMYNAAQSSREGLLRRQLERDSAAGTTREMRPPVRAVRATPGAENPTASAQHVQRILSRTAGGEGRDAQGLVRQLLEMGFPPSWCARAIASSNNDLDAALGWILTHDDELLGSGGEENKSEDDSLSAPNSAEEEGGERDGAPAPTYLALVSGTCDISRDLTCFTSVGGFPSVGCRGYAVSSGKWYYEVTLHTAGCVQIGWADCAFEGGADAGQGVGDDIHSWAYDGWRTYLWHEISAEWGAKWKPGDVVGCALDMDNQIMSFFLNGYGKEVNMGEAFRELDALNGIAGGLYPCASFNRSEKIQFNFGLSEFKHTIPEGYHPFHDRITAGHRELEFTGVTQSDHQQDVDEKSRENAFEEQVGNKSFSSLRRYFQSDDANRSTIPADYFSYFSSSSHLFPPMPKNRSGILAQLKLVGKDLNILYSRQCVIRLLSRLGTSKKIDLGTFLKSISSTGDSVASIFQLMRLSSCTSYRTIVYLTTMSILPPTLPIPQNLGSLITTGGPPMLASVSPAFSALVSYGLNRYVSSPAAYSVIDGIVKQVHSILLLTVSRSHAAYWRVDESFIPFLLRNGHLTDSSTTGTAPLFMAYWMTGILVVELIRVIEETKETEVDESKKLELFVQLTRHWIMVLKSPSTPVKLTAMRVLSYLIQEFTMREHRFFREHYSAIAAVITKSGVQRMMKHVQRRLAQERNVLPICSEYLQTLLEFLTALRKIKLVKSLLWKGKASGKLDEVNEETRLSEDNTTLPAGDHWSEIASPSDANDPNFSWETMSGRLLSDQSGWRTLSGFVRMLKVYDLPTLAPGAMITNRSRLMERQDFPPELMPGCKVSKTIPKPKLAAAEEAEGEGESESTSSKKQMAAEDRVTEDELDNRLFQSLRSRLTSREGDSPIDSISRLKRIFERSTDSTKDPDADADQFIEQIGTVLSITDWPNDPIPGTAREIQWDESGEREVVRWGADNGVFDVNHVLVKNGKVVNKYPNPTPLLGKILGSGFGSEQTYGIIVRLRFIEKKSSTPESTKETINLEDDVVAIVEWPDFNATVLATGSQWKDGHWLLTEKKLISGPPHIGWEARFGTSSWQSGTQFSFSVSQDCTDPTDHRSCLYIGDCSFRAKLPMKTFDTVGDLRLQSATLFQFDPKFHASNVTISTDKLSVAKVSGGGQGCALGTVGFSTGVHFWEFKIEQADMGSIFLGVSEKPLDAKGSRLNRWTGSGFISNRTSYKTSPNSLGERVFVYGDHFHTGDMVGVLLDMNRGRIHFFLDGLKYGEHAIADLGEAFDNLSTPSNVKPRTLFPIVGLSKGMDRVTITPRWMSTSGAQATEEFHLYERVWTLLSTWNIHRPISQEPFSEHIWLYRQGWREFVNWSTSRFLRIRTRSRAAFVNVNVDVTPRACVEASVRLGLSTALFHGDRISFSKSSGRALEMVEEAIVLGAFNGSIWYRLDAQHNSGSSGLGDGGTLAWFLVPNDIEGMKIVTRNSKIPDQVINVPLPRLPAYHGGFIHLFHDSNAVLRDGLEIDTSEMLCSIPANTTLYALEQRLNASNIKRFRVLYDGNYGWISERMRGGLEEVMVSRVTEKSQTEIKDAKDALKSELQALEIEEKVDWTEVSSMEEAILQYEKQVRDIPDCARHLEPGELLSDSPIDPTSGMLPSTTFDEYLSLTATKDGKNQWNTEEDMQLVELISSCAAKEGTAPQNLSHSALRKAIETIDDGSSFLSSLPILRVLGRASLLRAVNLLFSYALPYINMKLPEESILNDCFGSEAFIGMSLHNQEDEQTSNSPSSSNDEEWAVLEDQQFKSANVLTNRNDWDPPCGARRFRHLRRLMFSQTKIAFWDSVLEATTSVTPLHQDEYEDPKEIKSLRINRVKATKSRLASISSPSERLKQSVFGQLHREMRSWPSTSFRRSYIGKGHGGQRRAFKVKFIGEGVNDYGGPYRALFEQVVDELQCDTVTTGGRKPIEKCLLPLLIPSPNKVAEVGVHQDKFVLSTSPATAPINQELMKFFGKLLGTAVRHNLNVALDLSHTVWFPLVRLPLQRVHLETVDSLVTSNLEEVERIGSSLESTLNSENNTVNTTADSYQPEEWADLTFSCYLPDGSRMQLVPGGQEIPVNLSNWKTYVSLVEQFRLQESAAMFRVLRDGLASVIPAELFPLFSPSELQYIVSGHNHVDIDLIRQTTEYEDIDSNSSLVSNFWEVLHEMTDEERTLFLRFVWARSRLPSSAQDLPMNFKLQGMQGSVENEPDRYLPHAQTCFFSMSLPEYSNKEVMREKILYAIKNSPNMDADVRLHSAEGWADS